MIKIHKGNTSCSQVNYSKITVTFVIYKFSLIVYKCKSQNVYICNVINYAC